MNVGIIVAAGKSERMGKHVDKAFLSLGKKPVLAYSLEAFEQCSDIDAIILVVRKDRIAGARGMAQMFGYSKVRWIVAGGSRRQDSVLNGMEKLSDLNGDVNVVAVHDGARPCVTPELIAETVRVAKRYGAGVAAAKVTDTIKLVERGYTVSQTVDRSKLWSVQTPQAFKRSILEEALSLVVKRRMDVTDESAAVELVFKEVHLVPSDVPNIKITTPADLEVAAALLKV